MNEFDEIVRDFLIDMAKLKSGTEVDIQATTSRLRSLLVPALTDEIVKKIVEYTASVGLLDEVDKGGKNHAE